MEGGLWCITPAGKILESNPAIVTGKGSIKWKFDLKGALEKWQALPEAERAPGAVKVGAIGVVDTKLAQLTPPPGTLILKLYYRAFMREENKLRYLTDNDLWHDEYGVKTEATLHPRISTPQAHPDHMWLSEVEWKSLMPANPRQGDNFPLPAGIADRLVRRHLSPRNVYDSGGDGLDRGSVRAAELSVTVEAVTATKVRLRLDGHANLGKQPPPAVLAGKIASMNQWGYEPKLLGFLEYDPQKQVFTRFEVVALGDQFGRVGLFNGSSRRGCQPLGVTFELVTGDRPADRIPPGSASTARKYFDPLRLGYSRPEPSNPAQRLGSGQLIRCGLAMMGNRAMVNALQERARRMLAHYDVRTPGQHFAEPLKLRTDQAYALQTEIARLRIDRGERVIGYKVGCTSRPIQVQLGVKEQIFVGSSTPNVILPACISLPRALPTWR